jgi:hypothetical protein
VTNATTTASAEAKGGGGGGSASEALWAKPKGVTFGAATSKVVPRWDAKEPEVDGESIGGVTKDCAESSDTVGGSGGEGSTVAETTVEITLLVHKPLGARLTDGLLCTEVWW